MRMQSSDIKSQQQCSVGRELREIANHIEFLCMASHGKRTVYVACGNCKHKADRLRAHALEFDRAAGIGVKAAATG